MDTTEYYKLIRNSVQLIDVKLVSMNCINRIEKLEVDEEDEDDVINHHVQLSFRRKVKVISENSAEIHLLSKIGVENGPFDFEIEYQGLCVATVNLSSASFEQYAYNQVVPLLIPYVRECVASTMARMGLPVFTIPTIDVLDSIEENLKLENPEE